MTRYLTGLTESHSSSWLSLVETSTFQSHLQDEELHWLSSGSLSFYLSLYSQHLSAVGRRHWWLYNFKLLGFSVKQMYCGSGINADGQYDRLKKYLHASIFKSSHHNPPKWTMFFEICTCNHFNFSPPTSMSPYIFYTAKIANKHPKGFMFCSWNTCISKTFVVA